VLDKATEVGLLHPIGAASVRLWTNLYADDAALFLRLIAADVENSSISCTPSDTWQGCAQTSTNLKSYRSGAMDVARAQVASLPWITAAAWQAKQRRWATTHRQGGIQAAELERTPAEQGWMPHAGKLSPILHRDLPHAGFQTTQNGR
jgi:hypothetical protein